MAIEFKLIVDPNPTVYRNMTIASQAYAVGDLVQLSRSAGTVTPATSSTICADVYGVAMESKTSSDTVLLVAVISPDQIWAADNANASVSTDNYQRMVLTDKGTVNNTHTDSTSSAGVWTQLGILAASRSVGRFNVRSSQT